MTPPPPRCSILSHPGIPLLTPQQGTKEENEELNAVNVGRARIQGCTFTKEKKTRQPCSGHVVGDGDEYIPTSLCPYHIRTRPCVKTISKACCAPAQGQMS